jgi:hypothetical protein
VADWKVTACIDLGGNVYTAVGDLAWIGPDGTRYTDIDALESAVASCQPLAVDNLPELVAETNLLYDACRAHEIARAEQAEQNARLEAEVRAARAALIACWRVLTGTPTKCGTHGEDFNPEAMCCARPRDTARALRALRGLAATAPQEHDSHQMLGRPRP